MKLQYEIIVPQNVSGSTRDGQERPQTESRQGATSLGVKIWILTKILQFLLCLLFNFPNLLGTSGEDFL